MKKQTDLFLYKQLIKAGFKYSDKFVGIYLYIFCTHDYPEYDNASDGLRIFFLINCRTDFDTRKKYLVGRKTNNSIKSAKEIKYFKRDI